MTGAHFNYRYFTGADKFEAAGYATNPSQVRARMNLGAQARRARDAGVRSRMNDAFAPSSNPNNTTYSFKQKGSRKSSTKYY